jgi:hypothetical protein
MIVINERGTGIGENFPRKICFPPWNCASVMRRTVIFPFFGLNFKTLSQAEFALASVKVNFV